MKGSVTFEGGKWRVRISVNKKRKTVEWCETEEEGYAVLAATLANIPDAKIGRGETVGQWAQKCVDKRRETADIRDTKGEKYKFEKHLLTDNLAGVSLRHLDRPMIVEYVDRLRAKKLAPTTVQKQLNFLRVYLQAALDAGYIKENPSRDVRVPKARERNASRGDRVEWAQPDEQARLLDAVPSPDRYIVGFAIGTGLRSGELCALRTADVILTGKNPHCLVRYGSVPNGPTKTGRTREVPLFGLGLESALAWQSATAGRPNKVGAFFPRLRGGFHDSNHVLRWDLWKGYLKKAGLPESFHWHSLRHTCASSLVSGVWGRSWSLLEVQAMLGHADAETTEIYAQFGETALRKAAREAQTAGRNLAGDDESEGDLSMRIHSVPPTRIELVTLALGRPSYFNKPLENKGFRDSSGHLAASAIALLLSVAKGNDADALALAHTLAESVLDAFGVQQALEVLENGPNAIRVAIDLAERFAGEYLGASLASEGA